MNAKNIYNRESYYHEVIQMTTTLEEIHKEIRQMQKDLCFVRHAVEKDYELSDETIRELEIARDTPRSEYIKHEVVKKRVLK
jgi:hypothetical protein